MRNFAEVGYEDEKKEARAGLSGHALPILCRLYLISPAFSVSIYSETFPCD